MASRLGHADFQICATSRPAVAPTPEVAAVTLDVTDRDAIHRAACIVDQQTGSTGVDLRRTRRGRSHRRDS